MPAGSDNFAAAFAASHFTVLAKLRQRVLDAADKPDLPLSEVDKAVTIEIKIENYLHKVREREEKALRTNQSRSQSSQPIAIRDPEPKAPPSAPPPSPCGPSAACQLRIQGFKSGGCPDCVKGHCPYY